MSIPDRVQDDAYRGLKKEFRQIPWTMISVGFLWAAVCTAYLVIYPQLARADAVKEVEVRYKQMADSIRRMEKTQIEKELIDTIIRGCQAPSKQYFTMRRAALIEQYEEITGKMYREPKCSELE